MPEPDRRPISWCRILAVGPACARLCAECTAVAQRRRERERTDGEG